MRLSALVGGILLSSFGVSAQSGTVGQRLALLPQDISFGHIQRAMEVNGGSYYVEQIRRRRDAAQGGALVGQLEQLLFLAASGTQGARFMLEFTGVEGRQLSSTEFKLARARFERREAYTFFHGGFRVSDAARAEQAYQLVYLATDRRVTREDPSGRKIYRFVVLPHSWDRSAWVIELDAVTCYPLYSASYSLDSAFQVSLQSELVVTSYIPGVRVPNASQRPWWSPIKQVSQESAASAALSKALPNKRGHVLPSQSALPFGFALSESKVLTDTLTGEKSAVLAYSDGLETLFVHERSTKFTKRGASDEMAIFSREGLTQMIFKHHGVEFMVMGRLSQDRVREISVSMFSDAIRKL